jgi:NIMA (never in mitosis gene a)-related kinase
MLFCDGGDLYTKIKEQNGVFLQETQIVEWFVQIAMALQVALLFLIRLFVFNVD